MGSSTSVKSTGPTSTSNTSVASLRKRLETLETAVKRLNANRTPPSLLVHQLANTLPMSQVKDGQTLIYNKATGEYEPGLTTEFVLGNDESDLSQVFSITANGDNGYVAEYFLSSGSTSPSSGHADFQFSARKATSAALLGMGVDSGPSVAQMYSDTLLFGALDPSTLAPSPGRGNLSFFATGGSGQVTITGSKGGNAALTALLTALADYGLIIDHST